MRQLLIKTALDQDCFPETDRFSKTAFGRLLLEDCIFKANLSCNADFGGLQGGLEKTSKNVCFSHFWRSVLNPHEDPQLPLAFQRAMIFEG